jgi:hypothetical protein
LQRIESSNKALEDDIRDIKSYIRASSTNQSQSSKLPLVSVIDDDAFKVSLSAALMKHAEVLQPWRSIGVDQWIQAGRWWLLKVGSGFPLELNWSCSHVKQSQMELYTTSAPNQAITLSAYTNLVKASWILVDVIACHPQLTFLDSSMHYEVQLLSAVSHLHVHIN